MTFVQWILLSLATVGFAYATWQLRAGRLPVRSFVFWALWWIALGVVSVLPETTVLAARFVGVGRGADLAVYAALIVLFLVCLRLTLKLEDQERELTRLVRALALERDLPTHE